MKKFFSCGLMLAASLSMMAGVSQTVHTNEMNPYAYGVKAEIEDGMVAITYQLNAPANSSEIVIYRDGEEVRTQVCEGNSIGLKSEVVDLSEETVAGTYTFGIRVYGTSVEAPTQLVDATNPNNPLATYYGFDHPKAVDVDVNPFSPNFGRVLACEALAVPGDEWWSEGKCGIYAFDPTFAPITNGNDRAFTGGVAFNTYSPYRLRITKDGRIFATSQCDQTPVMWEISSDLQTWTPFFVGSYDDNLSYMTADGKFIAGTNCGFDVDGEGENLQFLMLSANNTAYSSKAPKDFFVAKYNVGTATSWAAEATEFDTLKNFCAEAAGIVVGNANICSDHNGGWWYKAPRSNAVGQHGMFHVNANGVKDWDLGVNCVTAADSLEYGINANGNNGGGGIRVFGDIMIAGTGRDSNGKGKFIAWKVSADAAGAPVLTKLYTYEIAEISTNLNDFALDYANNLFVVGNSNEKLCVVMLPYSGVVETPVATGIQVVTRHFTLSATSSNDSYGKVSGSGTYRTDSAAVLLATPKYGYHFTQWSDGNTENPRTILLTKDTTFVAEFEKNTYTCNTEYEESQGRVVLSKTDGSASSNITLNLRDSYGDGWGGCAFNLTDGEHSFNCTVSSGRTATYTIPYYGKPYTIRWTKGSDPNECSFDVIFQGETTSYSSLSSYSTGAIIGTIGSVVNSFEYLTDLTLTASPATGYHFSRWSNGNTDNPRTFVITCDTTFHAEFAKNSYEITTSAATAGGTTKGDTIALYQDRVTITATADYGYYFYAWQDGNSTNPRTITVSENKEYAATFRKQNFTISVTTSNSTMGTVSGSGSTPYQETRTIYATERFGYEFTQWNDGNTENPRSIQVESDSSFVAYFRLQKNGECGANLTWRYAEGTLYISGTGTMSNFSSTTMPWLLLRDSIETVSIDNDVTSIGNYAFYGCQNRAFRTLTLPQSIITIGSYAFANCNRLTSINFSNDLEEVGNYAFSGCTRVNDMTIYATITPDAYNHTFDGVNTMAYLYVLPGSVRTYKLDPIWGVFDIQSIAAEGTTTPVEDMVVEPSDNEASFTWPTETNAATYSLQITKDGDVFCVLTFNANGQLTGIAFAPGRDGANHAPAAEFTTNGGMTFTVTGLNSATAYTFTFDAKDAAQNVIASYQGTFATTGYVGQNPDTPTSVDNVMNEDAKPQKILRDGVLYILTPDGIFDATGRKVKE